MQEVRASYLTLCLTGLAALWCLSATDPATAQITVEGKLRCEALLDSRNLTLTRAEIAENPEDGSAYCYVRGIISPAIHFHAQLPLPGNWNGRFLQWGDGGKDGDLDFANHRVAEGYAVTNSNMGHDNGVEPGAYAAYTQYLESARANLAECQERGGRWVQVASTRNGTSPLGSWGRWRMIEMAEYVPASGDVYFFAVRSPPDPY